MMILITCALVAGFVFSPPEGYVLDKVSGPPKQERTENECVGCLTTHGSVTWSSTREPDKVTLHLRPIGKTSDVIELPPGCTGEESGTKFRSRAK